MDTQHFAPGHGAPVGVREQRRHIGGEDLELEIPEGASELRNGDPSQDHHDEHHDEQLEEGKSPPTPGPVRITSSWWRPRARSAGPPVPLRWSDIDRCASRTDRAPRSDWR